MGRQLNIRIPDECSVVFVKLLEYLNRKPENILRPLKRPDVARLALARGLEVLTAEMTAGGKDDSHT